MATCPLPSAASETREQRIEAIMKELRPKMEQTVRELVERVSDVWETLVVFREKQSDGTWKHDYLLSNAWMKMPLEEFARVFKAEHRIEECLQRAKGEAGLADYKVRTWEGWHHHQTLALMATWFLTQETRRGKNPDARADGAASAEDDRPVAEWDAEVRSPGTHSSDDESPFEAKRRGAALPLAPSQPLAAQTV